MKEKVLNRSGVIWLILRLYEFFFVFLISLFWLVLFTEFEMGVFSDLLKEVKMILIIWGNFCITFLYLPISFFIFIISNKFGFRNFMVLNSLSFLGYSSLLDLYIYSYTKSESMILGFLFIWLAIGVFNYFSPKLLPKLLRLSAPNKT